MMAVKHISVMLEDALLLDNTTKMATVPSPANWHPPRHGYLKVNTDGAFNGVQCTGGSSSVIRDYEGWFIAAETRWYNNLPDVLTIEALATRDGLQLAIRQGCNEVILESDNLTLVNMMRKIRNCRYLALNPRA